VLAVDLTQIPENNAEALKAAVKADGGVVEGEPCIATESAPDGKPVKLLVFPTATAFISLPETPRASYWAMSGWRKISLNISVNEWQMKIGNSLSQSGMIDGDMRGEL